MSLRQFHVRPCCGRRSWHSFLVLRSTRRYVHKPAPPVTSSNDAGTRISDEDTVLSWMAVTPKPRAWIGHNRRRAPAPTPKSPAMNWAFPFQLPSDVKIACTPFCAGLLLL